jgi:hypothetical protein
LQPAAVGISLLAEGLPIKDLHLVAGPRGFTEEIETGLQGRVVGEATDTNSVRKFIPTVFFLQLGKHLLELDSVERVV